MRILIYCNLNNSGGNLVVFAELGSILTNFWTAAHVAFINDLKLMGHCILRCDAVYHAGRSATVDEILASFPSHSKFKVHKVMSHIKAVKYGTRAVFLIVSTNDCLYNAYTCMWKRFWQNHILQDSSWRIRQKNFSKFQINQPTRYNNSSSLSLDVYSYVQLNKFRASSRPSSGAQQLQQQPLVIPLERGGSSDVCRGRAD
jgi:hypothetical protein